MIFKSPESSLKNFLRLICIGVLALVLAACGGGGGSPGTVSSSGSGSNGSSSSGNSGSGSSSSTTATPTLTLKLLNSSGTAANQVSTSAPLTAQATVLDATGAPVPNTLVNFSTGQIFTVIAPASAQVLTNSSGVATVTLSVASLDVAQTEGGSGDILTAQATVDSTVAKGTAAFSIGAASVSLNLVAPSTGTVNLPAYSSTLIKVNVLANGVLYTSTPVSVNFSSGCAASGKASMPATALTVNGQAVVSYTDHGCSSSDAVTISLAGASPLTATMVDAAPAAASIEFVSATPAGEAIVIQGAGGNGRVETATLTFEALDTFGNPLPNETVNFTLNSTQPVTLETTSGVTDANGHVTVSVSSGASPTTFRVIAALPSGQSTISDTITVTTGQPVQAAFSLSAASQNIEGWDYDNTQTAVSILLADQNGNPVADGTPVIFETDSGAIGSSSSGGCVTTNGGCSVTFRSQNPRYGFGQTPVPAGKRGGLATVSVSTTSALYTLSGQIGIFLSGSFANTNIIQSPSGTIALSNCNSTIVTLQVNDVNENPLPSGTTFAAAAVNDASGTPTSKILNVFPATINSIGPASLSGASTAGPLGSVHTIQFTPGGGQGATNQCVSGGAGTSAGQILVTVTTPKGNITQYYVNFTYPN